MRALYIHLHCAKENGKSPIVAKMEAANAAAEAAAASATLESGPAGEHDANGVIDPSRNEANTHLEALEIDSLKFTNDNTQAIYVSGNLYIYSLKFHTSKHNLTHKCTLTNGLRCINIVAYGQFYIYGCSKSFTTISSVQDMQF